MQVTHRFSKSSVKAEKMRKSLTGLASHQLRLRECASHSPICHQFRLRECASHSPVKQVISHFLQSIQHLENSRLRLICCQILNFRFRCGIQKRILICLYRFIVFLASKTDINDKKFNNLILDLTLIIYGILKNVAGKGKSQI